MTVPRPFQPVAIVAATCILPGAPDLDALWRTFDREETAIGRVPDAWLDRDVYYSADANRRNTSYSETAALLPPWEFSRPPRLPPKQLAGLDPTHRLALELGQRVTGQLAESWLPKETTGVWIANTSGALANQLQMIDYLASARWSRRAAALRPELAEAIGAFQELYHRERPHPREDGAINGAILSGRVANYFDLQGPQMSVDAACASSMAALRDACICLEDGAVDMALIGSVGTQSPAQLVIQAAAHAIAARPSYPFDQDASGFVPGEGAVMVALVRAEEAERRGLRTLGVIRSIGASLNGRGTSPWSPSEAAERLAINRAWEEGEFSPDGADGGVDYIEAHGTATPVGDRTEFAAMLATYGKAAYDGPVPFGSVKSVIGHTVENAGLAGVLRALYVFDSGRLPASVGVTEPADFASADADRLRLLRHGEPVRPNPGRPRRVAVSSFGVGGVNYHALLESGLEADAVITRTPPSHEALAVVGVSAIMPDAPDAEAVWQHLSTGTAVRKPLAEHIPDFDLYRTDDVSQRARTVAPMGSVVGTERLREPARWRVLPNRAERMFTDHVLLLNAASQLVETGAVPDSPQVRARSGVYVTDVMDSDSRNTMMARVLFEQWWARLRRTLTDRAHAAPEALDGIESGLLADADLGLRPTTEDDSTAGLGVQGAARVAAGLDFGGNAVAVNSACASGLAALSIAMRELRAGTLDFAMVGGSSIAVDEVNQVVLSAIGSLSSGGVGRPYDEQADGFLIGSGAVWLALKRLSDAERDGDRVLAVIRECVGASDGKGKSLLAPSSAGRREVIRRTFDRAGIDPTSVQYAEGHGAANVLGDASELAAIGAAVGTVAKPVRVGSIKGNYGHLKGPAALAGLLKVVLCLSHGSLVPTPGFNRRGPLPGVDDQLVRVTDRYEPWPENSGGQARRASVNAFGLGGTNFHAIVDEYRPQDHRAAEQDDPGTARRTRPPLLQLAAMTPEELARALTEAGPEPAAAPAGAAAAASPASPASAASAEGRESAAARTAAAPVADDGQWRAAVFVRGGKAEQAARLALAGRVRQGAAARIPGEITDLGAWTSPEGRRGPAVALFPGQAGAQHFSAVAWLTGRGGSGRAALTDLEEVLGEPGRTLRKALTEDSIEALGDLRSRSGTSQVLGLVASQLTWRRFAARNDRPVAVLGHSAGEFAALVAAGVVGFRDALRVVWERGCFAEDAFCGNEGLMAAVFAGPERVQRLVDEVPGAFVGTVNGPGLCVIAGRAEAIRTVLEHARQAGIDSRALDIGLPFHTPLLADAAPRLRALLADIPFAAPRVPVYSAVLTAPYPADVRPDSVRDAVTALYTEPVRLDLMVAHAARAGVRRFVECGTGRSLSQTVGAVLPDTPHLAIAGVANAAEGLDRFDAALWVSGLAARTPQPTVPAPADGLFPAADDRPVRSAVIPRQRTVAARERRSPLPFRAFTPVGVAVEPYRGASWQHTRVVVATARSGAAATTLADGLARRISQDGAAVEQLAVAELVAGAAAGGVPTVPAERLTRALTGQPGRCWLVWVSPPRTGGGPLGIVDGAATMAELACLRAAVRAFADRWEQDGDGGLLLVTGTDGRFGDGLALADPSGGALAGFARALSHEYPRIGVATVDLGRDLRPAAAAERIAALGAPPAGHHDLGVSGTGFWTTELTALPVVPGGPHRPAATGGTGLLRALAEPDAAVVVSGGSTGIVARILAGAARELTGPLPGLLVLVSRTAPSQEPLADPEGALERTRAQKTERLLEWRRAHPGRSLLEFEQHWRQVLHAVEGRATLGALRAAGIEVRHEPVDVTDARAVLALGERLRLDGFTIRTLVHGAGVERSSRITDKAAEEWESVLAVKVLGLHHLVAAAGDGLRTLVAHGSMSGSLGLPGQTDYSAANDYLAKAVARLRAERPGLVAQYLGWPAWDQIGMAADATIKRRLQDDMGLSYLPPDLGARWAGTLVAHAASLPPQIVLGPVPLPELPAARAVWQRVPDEPWWLVDTVTDDGATALVRRRYDTADPRDAELGDHRVRDNIRVAAVQLVEQFAEAWTATAGGGTADQGVPEQVELRDLVLRQGLVTATSGRRPTTVVIDRQPDGSAALRLETVPLLPGDFPGPGAVRLATAAVPSSPGPAPAAVDVGAARPRADAGEDPIALARRYTVSYGGRFATAITPLSHPDFDAAGRFRLPPPPPRGGRVLGDPAAMDIALRLVAVAAVGEGAERGLPSAVERAVLHPDRFARLAGSGQDPLDHFVFVTARPQGGYDVLLTGPTGLVLALFGGLRLSLPSEQAERGRAHAS